MSLLFLHYAGRTELQPSPLDSKLDLASMAFSEAFLYNTSWQRTITIAFHRSNVNLDIFVS